MIAQIRIVFTFLQRLDRKFLLRAPMLWRTRLFHLLALLIMAVATTTLFIEPSNEDPRRLSDIGTNTVSNWWLGLYVATGVIALWIFLILRTRVGELAPSRHIVTVVAVAVGSYLWLVAPGLLAYRQIDAIKRAGPSDQVLDGDLDFLSQYRIWRCVPQQVWDEPSNLERLRNVLARYGHNGELKKEPSGSGCTTNGVFALGQWFWVYESRETIRTIREAREFWTGNYNKGNPFYSIIGHSWWLVVALAIGMLAAILSYPAHTWRRLFLKR